MPIGLQIDELLYKILASEDLLNFAPNLARNSLTKVDHYNDVTDKELHSFGLPPPAIRRLRNALLSKDIKKMVKKRAKHNLPITYLDVSRFDHTSQPKPPPVPVEAPKPPPEEMPSTSSGPLVIFKSEVKLMEGLGEGTFAVVKRALWKRSEREKVDVAVKILREVTEEVKKDLQEEISTMSRLRHPNLIQLYGVVLSDPMWMVLEFCEGGALLDRLRDSDKPVLFVTQMLHYAVQICSGMVYLESKGYVHRDLATRNVLLSSNEETVKICDFGMSRLVNDSDRTYDMHAVKKVPFAWCPPESLRFRKFSSASDVYAFGVTLWEIWTGGEDPFPCMKAVEVLQATERGERLRRPEKAWNKLFDLMSACWALQPADRPDFPELEKSLREMKVVTLEALKDYQPVIPAEIAITNGSKFLMLEEATPTTIFGQSCASRLFGHLPKSLFREINSSALPTESAVLRPMRTAPSQPPSTTNSAMRQSMPMIAAPPPKQHQPPPSHQMDSVAMRRVEISRPIPNSFIHASHGDSSLAHSWGDAASIPDVYLKNPVTKPIVGTDFRPGITLMPATTTTNVPVKPSLPRSPPNVSARSNSTLGSSSCFGENSISSIEDWNRTTMSSGSDSGNSSYRSNGTQAAGRKEGPPVVLRPQNDGIVQPRPKTTIETTRSASAMATIAPPPSRNESKVSLNEQVRNRQLFEWIGDEIKNSTRFSQAANRNTSSSAVVPRPTANGTANPSPSHSTSSSSVIASKPTIQVGSNGNRLPPGAVSVMPQNPNPSQPKLMRHNEPPLLPLQLQSATTLSSLTLANTSLPVTTGFSPRDNDPFVVSDQFRAIATKPLFADMLKPQMPPASSAQPLHHVASASSMMPPPMHRPLHELNGFKTLPSRQTAAEISNELRTLQAIQAMSKQAQRQQQQQQQPKPNATTVAQAIQPLLTNHTASSSIYPSVTNSTSRTTTAPSGGAPQLASTTVPSSLPQLPSLLPPPSPLMTSLCSNVKPTATASVLRPQTNGSTTAPQPVRVLPGTLPPSSGAVPNVMTTLQRPIGWLPSVRYPTVPVSASETRERSTSTPATPRTPVTTAVTQTPTTPTTNTNPTTNSNTSTTTTTNNTDLMPSNANDLLNEVQKKISADTMACRNALKKHNFNVDMAVKELKIQSILALGFVKDRDLVVSALDSFNWDLEKAADRLLTN